MLLTFQVLYLENFFKDDHLTSVYIPTVFPLPACHGLSHRKPRPKALFFLAQVCLSVSGPQSLGNMENMVINQGDKASQQAHTWGRSDKSIQRNAHNSCWRATAWNQVPALLLASSVVINTWIVPISSSVWQIQNSSPLLRFTVESKSDNSCNCLVQCLPNGNIQ